MSNKKLWCNTHNEVYDDVLAALADCDAEFTQKDMEEVADKLATIKAEESFEEEVEIAMMRRKAIKEDGEMK